MFVNCSNHPSCNWSSEQLLAALKYGEIFDMPFPEVDPFADEKSINILAREVSNEIMAEKPIAVMCQGEMTLMYAIVEKLLSKGIFVVAACSTRDILEEIHIEGGAVKTSKFRFVQFRKFL